uniref:NEDD1 gamma-tubulin ring complex targeting factor n=1 Tax=Cyprinus carpio carpio TaxID=630221 RepID=A0A8C1EJL8_CYPCA
MEDVTRLVSSGDCLKIWDSTSMTVLEQFSPHSATHPVAQVCWSSSNQYLVSASSIGDKLVVSSLKSSPVPVMELGEGKKQTRVSLNSTSQFLVSGGLDNTVNIWDLKTKRLHRSLKDHKEEVTCVSFNGGDSYIASGSTSGEIILHSITTNLSSKPFGHGPNVPIHDLRYSLVKRSLLGTVSDSGSVALWDANTQKELHLFEGTHKAPCSGLAFSPANDLLFITVGLDKKIVCYDTSSKMVFRNKQVESPLTAIDFTPDGAGLVVGSTQGRIYMYDLRNLSAPVKITTAHKTSVTCIRFQNSTSKLKVQLSTPLGTPGSRCYSPSVVQTPPPIKEEESITTPPQQTDVQNGSKVDFFLFIIRYVFAFIDFIFYLDCRQVQKNNGLRQECDVTSTLPAAQSVNTYNSPEPAQRRDLPTQLTYDSPVSGAPAAAAPAAAVESGAEGRGAPLTSIQMNFVRNMIHEALEDFRDTCHRDIINLQVEMVRQFYIQLNEIHGLIEKYSVNDSLIEEIEKLREENKRLRANY